MTHERSVDEIVGTAIDAPEPFETGANEAAEITLPDGAAAGDTEGCALRDEVDVATDFGQLDETASMVDEDPETNRDQGEDMGGSPVTQVDRVEIPSQPMSEAVADEPEHRRANPIAGSLVVREAATVVVPAEAATTAVDKVRTREKHILGNTEISEVLVQPEDFAADSGELPGRLGGFEDEREVHAPQPDPERYTGSAKIVPPIDVNESDLYGSGMDVLLRDGKSLDAANIAYLISGTSFYLGNGANIHPDCGHAEYASQEVIGPEEMAAAYIAGGIIMERLVSESGNLLQVYQRAGSVDPESLEVNTRGFHLNYLTPSSTIDTLRDDYESRAWLTSVLATQFFAWNGLVTADGFIASQKSPHVNGDAMTVGKNRATGKDKAIIRVYKPGTKIKGDVLNHMHGFGRVEDVTKDPANPWGVFVASGEASVALRLIEHPEGREVLRKMGDYLLRNPTEVMREGAKDLTLSRTFSSSANKAMSIVSAQDRYTDTMLEFAELGMLPKDEERALDEARRAVDAMIKAISTHDYSPLYDRIGFLRKYAALEAKVKGPLNARNVDALRKCSAWDLRVPAGAGYRIFEKTGPDVVDPRLVGGMVLGEGMRTRAAIRGDVIKRAAEGTIAAPIIGWDTISFTTKNYRSKKVTTLHPYQTTWDVG